MQKFTLNKAVSIDDPATACEFLANHTGLSKSRIKDAMTKGAVWLKKTKGKQHRIRRATAAVRAGDILSINYDAGLLGLAPLRPDLISDQHRYSVWHKPAGLMTQGTKFGDHCSLLRQAELFFKSRREVFPVHRLDREAAGIVLLAHDKKAAGMLSGLFVSRQIIKRYHARVLGNLATKGPRGKIDQTLEGKSAVTEFAVTGYDPAANVSSVDVIIHTGRKHQIRRHFEAIGFPVIGDPRYGQGNKNKSGLKLMATSLEFHCPFTDKGLIFKSPSADFEAEAG
jgi:tRNA pseudouridine32 synthase/23S rRNA pseudouridine746 synthase